MSATRWRYDDNSGRARRAAPRSARARRAGFRRLFGRWGESAFSLVEVSVAIPVFLAGVLGALGYFAYSRSMLSLDRHRRTAAEQAHARQEELRTAAFADLPSYHEDGTLVNIDGISATRATVIENVDEDGDGTTDYRRVTVRVTWTEASQSQGVELVTLRSAYR